jgi:hypothetical protein
MVRHHAVPCACLSCRVRSRALACACVSYSFHSFHPQFDGGILLVLRLLRAEGVIVQVIQWNHRRTGELTRTHACRHRCTGVSARASCPVSEYRHSGQCRRSTAGQAEPSRAAHQSRVASAPRDHPRTPRRATADATLHG